MQRRPMRPEVRLVVLLGVVSLFADMTYEGGRSVTGPFMGTLGATATVVGIVAGLGELLGYGLRLVSGYLSDRTARYWAIMMVGYVVNLLAVPALALAGNWQLAALLVILERTGKAIRTPARDAMLAQASHTMGAGWGFGLHEAMDQAGALIGPLVVALTLHRSGRYAPAFAVLVVPAVIALFVLLNARRAYPRPVGLDLPVTAPETKGFPRQFWLYVAAGGLVAAGYADFPLVAFHFAHASVMPSDWSPVLYALGMGAAGASALIFGRLFDRWGPLILVAAVLVAAEFAPLVFLGGARLAVLGMVLWGVGAGAQESIGRAFLVRMVPRARLAAAYGTYDAAFGISWFLGSALMGVLYDRAVLLLVAFSVLTQVAAGFLILLVVVGLRNGTDRGAA
jgi:MFS family permease